MAWRRAAGELPLRRRRQRAASAVAMSGAAVLLLLAGCSGDSEPGTGRAAAPTAPSSLATVPSVVERTAAAVPFGAPATPVAPATPAPLAATTQAEPGGEVAVSVTGIEPVRSQGEGPGQFTGQPAVAFTLALRNVSGRAVDLDAVNVTVSYGAGDLPAQPDSGPAARPLAGALQPGQTASGVYVFLVPEEQRSRVTTVVSYDAAKPAVSFTGPVG
ncbi:hypothetical protein [Parafrankia colletiae]|nr:hypothetical protein [Parafrankia colletiae]